MFGGLCDCHKLCWQVEDGAKSAAWLHEQIRLEFLEGSYNFLELCDPVFVDCNPLLLPSQFHVLRDRVPNAPFLDGCSHTRV